MDCESERSSQTAINKLCSLILILHLRAVLSCCHDLNCLQNRNKRTTFSSHLLWYSMRKLKRKIGLTVILLYVNINKGLPTVQQVFANSQNRTCFSRSSSSAPEEPLATHGGSLPQCTRHSREILCASAVAVSPSSTLFAVPLFPALYG